MIKTHLINFSFIKKIIFFLYIYQSDSDGSNVHSYFQSSSPISLIITFADYIPDKYAP